jgi:hypothetical protein
MTQEWKWNYWLLSSGYNDYSIQMHMSGWRRKHAGFEVLKAVVIKNTIFWDTTPCSTLSVNGRFEGTHRLHLQGRKISWARKQRESRWQAEGACHLLSRWFLAQLIFLTLKMEPICSFETSVDSQRVASRGSFPPAFTLVYFSAYFFDLENGGDMFLRNVGWHSTGGNQRELAICFHSGFLLSLFFRPWRWRRYVPSKRRLTLNGLHGVMPQKMVLF